LPRRFDRGQPDGCAVFVTGLTRHNGVADYATVGYDAGTGAELWASRFKIGGTYGACQRRQRYVRSPRRWSMLDRG
jgi:hypothetical protein